MATAAPRHPLRAKSLTLLELCQTVQDLRHAPARNTSQILTRRLYFHPMTINPSTKQRAPKLIARGLLHVDQSHIDRSVSSRKPILYRDLAVLSSSLSVATRSNSKLTAAVVSDHNDDSNEFDMSTITSSFNQMSLAPIIQHPPLATKKRTVLTRSLYALPNRRKITLAHKNDKKKLNIWHYLDDKLDRPSPKDPPTTPLDYTTDYDGQNDDESDLQQQASYYSLQDIKLYQ